MPGKGRRGYRGVKVKTLDREFVTLREQGLSLREIGRLRGVSGERARQRIARYMRRKEEQAWTKPA